MVQSTSGTRSRIIVLSFGKCDSCLVFFINPKAGINLEYDGRCLVVPRANKIFGTVVVHNMD